MAEFEEVVNLKTKTSGAESVKSLKQEIREAQAEAVKVSREFGAFSKEATNAAKRVASLRDEMGDFQQRVAALNPDRFQAIAGITQGIAGGITAATGAMALFGSESEDVQKLLVKVQGAIAFSQGIQQILDLKNSFGAVATVIRTQVITAFTTLKGALISTGIGALVVAAGFLVQKLFEVSQQTKETTKDVQDLNSEFDKLAGAIDDLTAVDIANAKKRGASAKELRDIELQAINDKLLNIEVERKRKNDFTLFEDKRVSLERKRTLLLANFEAEQAEKKREADKANAAKALQDKKDADALRVKQQEEANRDYQGLMDALGTVKQAFDNADISAARRKNKEQKSIAENFAKSEDERIANRDALQAYSARKKKKLDDEEIAREKALFDAKQAGFDATSQLLGNLSQLFQQGSEEQKAFAVAQVLVDEAKAIASTIAGATAAAAAGGPAAPFLVGAYITSGLATVAANFKRVKDILKTSAITAPQQASAAQFNPVNSSNLPGSDEVAGRMTDMRVYVLEGDITKTQGKQQRNRNISVI